MNNEKYKVGFCCPPTHTQFKRGQSGNPSGRPRGIMDTDRMIDKLLNKKIVITQDGRQMKISKQQAMLMRATNEAINGNFKNLKLLLPRMDRIDEKKEARLRVREQALAPSDREILDSYLKGGKHE